MEAARNAISEFTGRGGREDTTVEERVNPSITSETIKPTRHEETTQAVDREIHQDHYHTTVLPVSHQEVVPEVHTHQMAPVTERKFEHDDAGATRERIETGLAGFVDSSRTEPTRHSTSAAQEQVGEHVHHHVHETVQPVIHKETIQPEVVHTTVPIHETHHAPSEHHGLSTLPAKTLQDFTGSGGSLTGGSGTTHSYEGAPRAYNPEFQEVKKPVDENPPAHHGLHDRRSTGHTSDSDSDDTRIRKGKGPRSGGAGSGVGLRSMGPRAGAKDGLVGSSAVGTMSSGHHQQGDYRHGEGALGTTGDGSGLTGNTGTVGSSGYGQDTSGGLGSSGVGSSGYGNERGLDTQGGLGSSGYDNDRSLGSQGGHGNSAAMGSGVAGVAAGAAAADLGRDHHRAGDNTTTTTSSGYGNERGLDTQGGLGSSGYDNAGTSTGGGLTGTALGGRTEGNTSSTAGQAYNSSMGTDPSSGGAYSTGFTQDNNRGNTTMSTDPSSGGAYSTGFKSDDNRGNTTMSTDPNSGGAYSTGFTSSDRDTTDRGSSGLGSSAAAGAAGAASGDRHGDRTDRSTTDYSGTDPTSHRSVGDNTRSEATEQPSRDATADSGVKGDSGAPLSEVQSPAQGRDPAVDGPEHVSKLTGTGVPGSHSAVFGLTPDGKQYDDTKSGHGGLQPAHSKHSSIIPGKKEDPTSSVADTSGTRDTTDTSDTRDTTGTSDTRTGKTGAEGIPEQMEKSKAAEEVSSGGALDSENKKPGAGLSGAPQGTGDVRPGENNTGPASEDTVNPTVSGDGGEKKGFMSNLMGSLSGRGSGS